MGSFLSGALQVFVLLLMMGFFFVTFATMGMVAAYKSLEHVKVRKCDDGKEEVFITLKLGPFLYRIVVPEENSANK